jgi:hypothetical protein
LPKRNYSFEKRQKDLAKKKKKEEKLHRRLERRALGEANPEELGGPDSNLPGAPNPEEGSA